MPSQLRERQRETRQTHAGEEKAIEDRGRDWNEGPQTKKHQQPSEAGKARNGFSPRASRGSEVLPTP